MRREEKLRILRKKEESRDQFLVANFDSKRYENEQSDLTAGRGMLFVHSSVLTKQISKPKHGAPIRRDVRKSVHTLTPQRQQLNIPDHLYVCMYVCNSKRIRCSSQDMRSIISNRNINPIKSSVFDENTKKQLHDYGSPPFCSTEFFRERIEMIRVGCQTPDLIDVINNNNKISFKID